MSVVGAEIAPVASPPDPASLYVENERLVYAMVGRLFPRLPRGIDREDVLQAGRLGLLLAARSWSPGRCSFAGWACQKIIWAVRNHLKRRGHRALPQAPLLRSKSGKEKDSLTQLAAPPGKDHGAHQEQVRGLLRLLPARERRVVDLLYGLGGEAPMTQEGIAALLGVAHQRVSQIVERALRRMRRAGERRGLGGAA